MQLTKDTLLFVTTSDGTGKMTLEGFCDAINGGLKWSDVIAITTDQKTADENEAKRHAIEVVTGWMKSMSPQQANKAADLISSRQDLMELTNG